MKFMRRFFIVLGVLFFIQLVGLGYLVVADPFNLRPLVLMVWKASGTKTPVADTVDPQSSKSADLPTAGTLSADSTVDTNPKTSVPAVQVPTINSAQAKALQSVGLDANAIANITPAQESCFVSILGAVRVSEIKAGAVPSAAEFFSVRSCL